MAYAVPASADAAVTSSREPPAVEDRAPPLCDAVDAAAAADGAPVAGSASAVLSVLTPPDWLASDSSSDAEPVWRLAWVDSVCSYCVRAEASKNVTDPRLAGNPSTSTEPGARSVSREMPPGIEPALE